jgi:hypothetical protein
MEGKVLLLRMANTPCPSKARLAENKRVRGNMQVQATYQESCVANCLVCRLWRSSMLRTNLLALARNAAACRWQII